MKRHRLECGWCGHVADRHWFFWLTAERQFEIHMYKNHPAQWRYTYRATSSWPDPGEAAGSWYYPTREAAAAVGRAARDSIRRAGSAILYFLWARHINRLEVERAYSRGLSEGRETAIAKAIQNNRRLTETELNYQFSKGWMLAWAEWMTTGQVREKYGPEVVTLDEIRKNAARGAHERRFIHAILKWDD